MSASDYTFTDSWETAASREAVCEVLLDLEHYVDWWPQVRAVASAGPDDAIVVCRSRLPYDLELRLHAESRGPELLRVGIDGPIRGYAAWRLTPVDGGTRLDFEQRVEAVARSFRWASYVAKPLLAANHTWMMRGAERGRESKLSRARR
ncbi:MAG TPA: SRPBCC family protein [Marmoricola sp.]|nr:SRPBCC family protein [Marmoricola sp.]